MSSTGLVQCAWPPCAKLVQPDDATWTHNAPFCSLACAGLDEQQHRAGKAPPRNTFDLREERP